MIKKKDWQPYKRKPKYIEIDIKDHDNQSMDFYKVERGKDKDLNRVIEKVKKKYGFEKSNPFLKKDFEW